MAQFDLRVLRQLGVIAVLCIWGQAAFAQVSVRSIESETHGWIARTTTVTIALDAPIPFRVSSIDAGQITITLTGAQPAARPTFRPGSVITRYDLTRAEGGAILTLRAERQMELQSASIAEQADGAALVLVFDAGARVAQAELPPMIEAATALPLVVLDPGHGGNDPGAVRDGISEKDIMLVFGQELRAILLASGRFEVLMTREADEYVSLRERVRFARQAGAAVFISLHSNTVTEGNATGSAIYTLSEDASSAEAAALAEVENRADTVGGVDLGLEDDDLALLLTDMAQRETNSRSTMLARATVEAMRHSVGVIRTNPYRSAGFRVLKAPDVPSMLIELGFLSDDSDRANMISERWRAHAAQGILDALDDWVERDRVLSAQAAPLQGAE